MIEIHLDGKPVTKLEAARAVNVTGGEHVDIGEPVEDGWIRDGIALGARSAYGAVRRPELSSGSFRADTPEEMRQQAQMILLAAEVAELAMMLAAEQDAAAAKTRQALAVATQADSRGAAQRARAGAAKSGFEPVAKQDTEAGPLANEPLDWIERVDGQRWTAELPDGRTAVIERLNDGTSFLPKVHESSTEFETGPMYPRLRGAAQWAAPAAEQGGA